MDLKAKKRADAKAAAIVANAVLAPPIDLLIVPIKPVEPIRPDVKMNAKANAKSNLK